MVLQITIATLFVLSFFDASFAIHEFSFMEYSITLVIWSAAIYPANDLVFICS